MAGPTFKSEVGRTKTVALEWPLVVDGVEVTHVTLRRLTGGEVAAFMKAVQEQDKDSPNPMWPNVDVSQEVYDAFDDDDRLKVDEAAMDFLPRRLRQVAELGSGTGASLSEPSAPK